MEEMQTLDLDKTAITELPSSICNLIGLEILNMDECPHLKQLPASICTLPRLWKITTNLCGGLSHFKMCEGGDEASSDCLAMSLELKYLYFSSCNLSDDSLVFCLSHFTNMIHLDLSFNKFTILPECIKNCHNLKFLLLDNCNQLQHIGGMPPNLEKLSAIRCTSLTESSKGKVLKPAFNYQPRKRNFILPGEKLPERLDYCHCGGFVSFWVRNKIPTTSLWILVKDDQGYVYNCEFSVHINRDKMHISSVGFLLSTIRANHIYMCDLQSIIQSTELPPGNQWNQVEVSVAGKTREIEDRGEIYVGVHVCNLLSNLENIRFMDSRRYIIGHNLLQRIQEQEDWEELKEDMNLDPSSTKSANSIENPMHERERDIMNKLQPSLEIEGYRGTTLPTWLGSRSYYNLIELQLTNCNNCGRIPALGQLPALRSLTIRSLESVVAVGSEFFKEAYCASLIPFPSLETLHFRDMTSWEEWHSIDVEAFPKLRTLFFYDCPKLIGSLPGQLLSLQLLEIKECPLLASSIPWCPNIQELLIIKSQNLVLQGQEFPPFFLCYLQFQVRRC